MLKFIINYFKNKTVKERCLEYKEKKEFEKIFLILNEIESIKINEFKTPIKSMHKSIDDYNNFLEKLIIISKDRDFVVKDFHFVTNENLTIRQWLFKNNIIENDLENKIKTFIKNGMDVSNIYNNMDKKNNIVISNLFKQYIINMCEIVLKLIDEED